MGRDSCACGNLPHTGVRTRSCGLKANPLVASTLACFNWLSKGFSIASCLPLHDQLAQNPLWDLGKLCLSLNNSISSFSASSPGQRRRETPEALPPELHHLPKTGNQEEHAAPEGPGGESAACVSQPDPERAENPGEAGSASRNEEENPK